MKLSIPIPSNMGIDKFVAYENLVTNDTLIVIPVHEKPTQENVQIINLWITSISRPRDIELFETQKRNKSSLGWLSKSPICLIHPDGIYKCVRYEDLISEEEPDECVYLMGQNIKDGQLETEFATDRLKCFTLKG